MRQEGIAKKPLRTIESEIEAGGSIV